MLSAAVKDLDWLLLSGRLIKADDRSCGTMQMTFLVSNLSYSLLRIPNRESLVGSASTVTIVFVQNVREFN